MINTPGYTISENTIHFIANFPTARTVALAADFTQWDRNAQPLQQRADGLWSVSIPSPSVGLHTYKYLVDQQWVQDPSNPNLRGDGYGGYNSTLLISPHNLYLGEVRSLRIASLNLHTYQEQEALFKLNTIAETFANLDIHIAALQEVAQNRLYPARQPNAGEVIRRRLEAITGVAWFHEWRFAHIGFDVYDEGVSLLSRLPLSEVREHMLGGRSYRRVAVSAVLPSTPPLRLCSAHTSWPSDGGEEEISALLGSLDGDAQLVAGDLNSTPNAPTIQQMKKAGFQDVGASFTHVANTFSGGHGPAASRIDYHLLRPGASRWRAVSFTPIFNGENIAGIEQSWVSDHVGLLGVYESEH